MSKYSKHYKYVHEELRKLQQFLSSLMLVKYIFAGKVKERADCNT